MCFFQSSLSLTVIEVKMWHLYTLLHRLGTLQAVAKVKVNPTEGLHSLHMSDITIVNTWSAESQKLSE